MGNAMIKQKIGRKNKEHAHAHPHPHPHPHHHNFKLKCCYSEPSAVVTQRASQKLE